MSPKANEILYHAKRALLTVGVENTEILLGRLDEEPAIALSIRMDQRVKGKNECALLLRTLAAALSTEHDSYPQDEQGTKRIIKELTAQYGHALEVMQEAVHELRCGHPLSGIDLADLADIASKLEATYDATAKSKLVG